MEARKIIITGAATRMGAAIAKKLSGPNIEIVIHYNKSKSKAESLKKNLNKSGTKIYLVKADLTKENEIEKMLKFSKTKLKYFDCLINNASLFENDKLGNFTSKSWDSHLKANLKAPALLSQGFAKNIRVNGIAPGPTIKNKSITGQVLAIDSGQNLNWQTPDIMGGKE